MFGLKIRINGEVVSVLGTQKAKSLQITVMGHPGRNACALLLTHGAVAETPGYQTTREWARPRQLYVGDAVAVEVVDVAAVGPERGTIIFGLDQNVAGQRAELFCSWCGKSEHVAKKLVAGPQVSICDECVKFVGEIINESAT